jgi:hypothetical protein
MRYNANAFFMNLFRFDRLVKRVFYQKMKIGKLFI